MIGQCVKSIPAAQASTVLTDESPEGYGSLCHCCSIKKKGGKVGWKVQSARKWQSANVSRSASEMLRQ